MILRLKHLILLITLVVCGPACGAENQLSFDPPHCATGSDEIVIDGVVNATGNVTLVFRVDDARSSSYATGRTWNEWFRPDLSHGRSHSRACAHPAVSGLKHVP